MHEDTSGNSDVGNIIKMDQSIFAAKRFGECSQEGVSKFKIKAYEHECWSVIIESGVRSM